LTWHFARPPVQGLDFEVDVRGVAHEIGDLTRTPNVKIATPLKEASSNL
jgi:hypothetical protein